MEHHRKKTCRILASSGYQNNDLWHFSMAKQYSHWTDIPIRISLRMNIKALKDLCQTVGTRHNGHININGSFIPVAGRPLPNFLFSSSRHARRTLLTIENLKPAELVVVYSGHCDLIVHPSAASEIIVTPIIFPERVCPTSSPQLKNPSQRSSLI
jgi:hypothetical protein